MNSKNLKINSAKRWTIVIIIMTIFIVVPLLFFRILTDKVVNRVSQAISLQYSQELNEQMSANVSSTFDFYFHELNTEYHALGLIDNLTEDKLRTFIKDTMQNNNFSYLAFVDQDGYVYEKDNSYLGTLRITGLGKLLNGSERIIEDNVTIGNDNYILVGSYFTDAIKFQDKEINICILGMNNNDFLEHIVLHSDYSGSYSSIIHADGSYIIKNQNEQNSGLNIFSILDKNYQTSSSTIDSIKESINKGETYFLYEDNNTENENYLYFAPIEVSDWYIVNTLPSSFIKTSIVDLRNSVEIFYFVFIGLFIFVAGIILILQIISGKKLKRSQIELEKALAKAEEASGAKSAFLFNMSHDIRTPMNAILGFTDIGLKHVDDQEISKESYGKIKVAGGHLLNLINDILEMSRIESGKMELKETPLDIRTAINDVITMSESLAINKSIDFTVEIGEITNPYLYVDELHINEVLINIINNAVKYTHNGGKVSCTINQIDQPKDGKITLRFEISDNGIGMSEEFQTHLFETFSREVNSTMSKTEGTGLGLAIVKNILDMAGGTIKVKSEQNVGSTFTLEIPFRTLNDEEIKAYLDKEQKIHYSDENYKFEGKKVLLVEDNEMNREIATYILEDKGMQVDYAEDGSLAVKMVEAKGATYYDFILMDIQMPVMNGYEATKVIRSLPNGNDAIIIALSANAFEEDKIKSIKEGMNAHIAKPIDINDLLETLQRLDNKKIAE